MFSKTFAIVLAAVTTLAACGGSPYETGAEDDLKVASRPVVPAAPTYALKQTDAHTNGTEPVWKSSFPIASTYFIYTATQVTGTLSGHHRATVFVYEPNGQAYQQWDIAFATDVAAGTGEQQAEKTATGWRIWAYMPVAATTIQSYNMVGTWKSDVRIDGAGTPNAVGSFSLF